MSLCMFRDDTKLSPPAFMDLFTHNWYLSCHRSLVCVVFGCLFRVLFVVLFLGVLPVFLDERDSA